MADKAPVIRRRKLTDYHRDTANRNQGSERGRQMIVDSFRQLGAGRSLVADQDDVFIAGNQSLEAALEAGIEDVVEIESDGTFVVVVKRRDLDLDGDDSRGRRLDIADNRANEVNLQWDLSWLENASSDELADFFRDDEIDDLLAMGDIERLVGENLETSAKLRDLGDRKQQIKPVLYVDEVALFERAVRATGLRNRGQAVLELCRFYLHQKNET